MVCIALTVGEELRSPALGIRLRQVRVLFADVPEAPVDEDGHARTREHQISAASRPVTDASVDEEPPSAGVERSADRQLGRGVTSPEACHQASAFRCCFPMLHASTLEG